MTVNIIFTLLLLLLPAMSLHSETLDSVVQIPGRDMMLSPKLQAEAAKQECPTWFTGNLSRGCECHEVPGVVCRCNYALVFIDSCVTYHADTEQLQASFCPYSISLEKSDYNQGKLYIRLPDSNLDVNAYFCAGLNRTGVLCSKCQTGLGPPVLSYSYKCVQCLPSPYGWLLYIFLACFPTTVFSLLVFLFQVRANSPQLNFITFACHYLALIQMHVVQQSFTTPLIIIATYNSLWNLEFLRYAIPPFCVSESLSLVHVFAMEYLVASCPLFLILLIYVSVELHARGCKVLVCLWKPFRICCTRTRRWMDPRGSIVNAFATLLTLSYAKLVIVSVLLLQHIQFYCNNGERVAPKMAYLDASTQFYSVKYLPYLLLSSSVVAFLVVLPVIFLCLYPLRPFQRCLNTCGLSWHALHAFADSFNGHYKNRSDNTYECRYFGSFYMIFRSVVFMAFLLGGSYRWLVQIIMGVVAMFLLLSLRPYKDEIFNVMDAFFIGIWSLCILVNLYDVNMNANIPVSFYLASGHIPLSYIIVLVVLKLLVRTSFYRNHFLHFHKLRNLIERFVGSQSRDNGGAEANGEDSDFAHRLLYPAEYTPVSYGAITS